ncbi:MAG TPA: 16S rRNA (cytidine(1402)-2'-O)-methyltransferase [Aestuariivirgaceae bacterium]|jgi:16S rRNA (cytidine1402-2'-O)-methyltransferase
MSKAPFAEPRFNIARSTGQSGRLRPGLYLIATPIGNLGDVTLRALQALVSADHIYCEDTRVTSKLLARYNIARPLKPYHDHNAAKVRPQLLRLLAEGTSIALISDAGTPLISDPGYKLVVEAIARNVHVEMLPGPSAPVIALALSGLPTDRFLFAGFLPVRKAEKSRLLDQLGSIRATLIFFEAPGRVEVTIEAIKSSLGNRGIAIARELTKLHEEVLRGSPDEILAILAARPPLKGEVTIVVGPPLAPVLDTGEIEAALSDALKVLSPAKAAASIARKFSTSRRELYALALRLKKDDAHHQE